jgi:hypothetical protein
MLKKCRPEDMILFDLDYGELLRPPFEILRDRGWGQCTNASGEPLIVYGPKHERDRSIFDTSPYALNPGCVTPDGWDCDGFFVPSDREVYRWSRIRRGPLVIKYWNYRRFAVRSISSDRYACTWSNGVFQPSQINWAIPNLSHEDIRRRLGLPAEADSESGRPFRVK